MIAAQGSLRRPRRPPPTIDTIQFVRSANAEQARRRDEAIALLIELGMRQRAALTQPSLAGGIDAH